MNLTAIYNTIKAALVSKGVPAAAIEERIRAKLDEALSLVRASMLKAAQKSKTPNLYQFQVQAMSDLLTWAKANA